MKFNLIIPTDLKPKPTKDEMAVAEVLSNYFHSDIKFVARGISHTPDIFIIRLNQYWEIKNVRGNSPKTIENILRTAQYQSENIVISLARSRMAHTQAAGRVKQCLDRSHINAKRILLISKHHKILVLK